MRKMTIALVVASMGLFGLLGCDGDACISRCEQGKDMGCVDESVDCEMSCDDAEEARVTARANAVTAGCEGDFDAVVSCTDGRAACETGGCETETSALTSCFVAFCTDNPDSEACTAP